jgi:hypothetical protein
LTGCGLALYADDMSGRACVIQVPLTWTEWDLLDLLAAERGITIEQQIREELGLAPADLVMSRFAESRHAVARADQPRGMSHERPPLPFIRPAGVAG